MWNRRLFMSASDLETVSYATRCVAKALAEAPHWQILETYWNTAMQQDNIWSIVFEAWKKEILKEVCRINGARCILHNQTCTRIKHQSIRLNPISFNQQGTTLQSVMISTGCNLPQSIWNSLIPFWQTISIFLLSQSVWKVVYAVQIPRSVSRKLLTNGQRPLYLLAETIPGFIYLKFHHRANNRGKYADGFYNSLIDDKDGHIPSPLIMFTCTALRHALLEWQKNKGVHPKASKSKLKAGRPDDLNYFNCKNAGGKIVSCCAVTGRKLLTSPGIADTYTFLINTWNTLPESYQQRVYNNTLATVKRQIQQAENPTPAVVISREAARGDNVIHLDHLTSEVAIE